MIYVHTHTHTHTYMSRERERERGTEREGKRERDPKWWREIHGEENMSENLTTINRTLRTQIVPLS